MSACVHCGGEEVDFEQDYEGELICPSCGWSQSATKPNSRAAKAYEVEPREGWARVAAIVTLGLGVLSLPSAIAILDIVLGIALFRFKDWARQTVVVVGIVQLVIVAVSVPLFVGLMAEQPLLLDADRLIDGVAGGILVAPVKLGIIVILTRPAVKAAFLQTR